MTQALTFNDVTLTPIPHQNSLWIRAAELARALGLSREDKVAQIYQRHADEFTSDMTQLIENVVEPQNEVFQNLSAGRCRIFSLRGCHLVAMFARTPVAKAFRRWVLDVLEKYAAEQQSASSHPLADDMVLPASPDRPSRRSDPERKQLTAIINTWVSMAPIHYAAARAQVNAHFGVASVDALTVTQVREAIRWVQGKIDSLPAAAPALSGDEISALPPSTVSPYLLCLSRIEEVRELLRATCHPGAVTMKMTPQERKLYYACHAACVAADEALAGAYGILDAGRRMAEAARM